MERSSGARRKPMRMTRTWSRTMWKASRCTFSAGRWWSTPTGHSTWTPSCSAPLSRHKMFQCGPMKATRTCCSLPCTLTGSGTREMCATPTGWWCRRRGRQGRCCPFPLAACADCGQSRQLPRPTKGRTSPSGATQSRWARRRAASSGIPRPPVRSAARSAAFIRGTIPKGAGFCFLQEMTGLRFLASPARIWKSTSRSHPWSARGL
mmetsp:Transcript_3493/g.11700  ORF Transcript_3493/g.11700 Transcript_3493/m.11700 type:complete len:207 (+) Transcript_3493:562-1182(+)